MQYQFGPLFSATYTTLEIYMTGFQKTGILRYTAFVTAAHHPVELPNVSTPVTLVELETATSGTNLPGPFTTYTSIDNVSPLTLPSLSFPTSLSATSSPYIIQLEKLVQFLGLQDQWNQRVVVRQN